MLNHPLAHFEQLFVSFHILFYILGRSYINTDYWSLFINVTFTDVHYFWIYFLHKLLNEWIIKFQKAFQCLSSTLFNWLISQFIDFWLPHIFKIQNKWFYWVILTFQHHRHISLIITKVYKSQWKFLETTLSCFNLHKCKRLRTSADDEIVMLKEWGFPL